MQKRQLPHIKQWISLGLIWAYHGSLNAAENTMRGAPSLISWLLAATIGMVCVALVNFMASHYRKARFPHTQSDSLDAQWSNALEFFEEPLVLIDLRDRVIRGNRAYYQSTGKNKDEVIDTAAINYCHPPEETSCPICQARTKCEDATVTLEATDPKNYTGHAVEIHLRVIRDQNGEPIGILQHCRDLSHIREAEKPLRKSEAQFRALLEATPDPLIITDTNGYIVLVNQRCEHVLGYSRDELLGKPVEILVPLTVRHKHENLRNSYNDHPSARPLGKGLQLTAQCKSGQIIPVDISLNPIKIGDELYISTAIRDVTEQKRNERELKRLASFPRLNPMPIIEVKYDDQSRTETTSTGKISYVNPRAEFVFPDLLEKNTEHEVLKGLEQFVNTAKQTGKPQTRVIEVGEQVYEQQISYVADIGVAHINLWDVTTMHQLTSEMTYQASHDSLTGIINRYEFDRRVRAALQEISVENKHHALCYIDLDRFKIVNDQSGHAAGDALLKQLAKIIKSKIRNSDTVARLGGDEFGLLLVGCEIGSALNVLNNLLTAISDYRFIWNRKSFRVGASIGLVLLNNQGSGNISHVMQAADSACYVAKNAGGGRIHVYEPNDQALTRHVQNIEWAHKIQTALEKDQFKLYAQSIHSLSDREAAFHEILVRMTDADGNIVSPAAFIPAAERYHLIQAIDRWVIRQTFESIEKGVLKKGLYSINLSGDSLSDPTMLGFVIDMFDQYNIDAQGICFEITETSMVTNLFQSTRFMSTLKGLGCQFALDDFGSGVSSFSYLQSLAVDILKIDGTLVRAIAENKVNEVMVSSINTIGRTMNMKTVAEFVENENIVEKLVSLGIDYAQGYYFSKPLPIEEDDIQPEKSRIA